MKSSFTPFLLAALLAPAVDAQPLDPAYHDLGEIYAELLAMAETYPNWVHLDTIGYSSEFSLPIWIVKLSDNPGAVETEPALLYIGQVHAEEVTGVEITLELMRLLLENADEEPYHSRLQGLELYFIPTANPEGLRLVHDGNDVTYRKNCRDNVGDGALRYRAGMGWDTSGVDINRNFGLHWNRGDAQYNEINDPPYNYYRGPAPFSEPEARALAMLALERRFLFSLSYHSSRSGRNSELVISPWYWEGKRPPDSAALDALGSALAGRTVRQDGMDNYEPVNSTQRVGQSQDWFYQAAGCFQYLIEVGEDIQPDSAVMASIVNSNLNAAFYLMDLAIGEAALEGFGILSVLATDADTGLPLEGTIDIAGVGAPSLEPRKTSQSNGRFDWLLLDGDYDITITCRGYEPFRADVFSVPADGIAELTAELQPLTTARVEIAIFDAASGERIDGTMRILDGMDDLIDFLVPAEEFSIELPVGEYAYRIIRTDYLPLIGSFEVAEDDELNFETYPAQVAYIEDFDVDRGWQRGGAGSNWDVVDTLGITALTESVGGEYAPNTSTWLLLETGVEIDSTHRAAIEIVHRPYFEPGADYGLIRVWHTGIRGWVTVGTFSQFDAGWDTSYYNLSEFTPGEVQIRLQVSSDGSVGEDGWLIDRVAVHLAQLPDEAPHWQPAPANFRLTAFPNPFNPSTTIHFTLPQAGRVRLGLFDPLGKRVRDLTPGGWIAAGEHQVLLNAGELPTGVFILRLSAGDGVFSQKVALIR